MGHVMATTLKRKSYKGVAKISYRLKVTNLNPLLTQQLLPKKNGKVNGNKVKENFTISPTRLTEFSEKVHVDHHKNATKLLTFTAARMLYGKV